MAKELKKKVLTKVAKKAVKKTDLKKNKADKAVKIVKETLVKKAPTKLKAAKKVAKKAIKKI